MQFDEFPISVTDQRLSLDYGDIIYRGYLTKSPPLDNKKGLSKFFKSRWRKRFFYLYKESRSEDSFHLDYFNDDSSCKPKGSIDLSHCRNIVANARIGSREHVFSFKTKHKDRERVYYLAADTGEEMERWVRHLCQVTGCVTDLDKLSVYPEDMLPLTPRSLDHRPSIGSLNRPGQSPAFFPRSLSGRSSALSSPRTTINSLHTNLTSSSPTDYYNLTLEQRPTVKINEDDDYREPSEMDHGYYNLGLADEDVSNGSVIKHDQTDYHPVKDFRTRERKGSNRDDYFQLSDISLVPPMSHQSATNSPHSLATQNYYNLDQMSREQSVPSPVSTLKMAQRPGYSSSSDYCYIWGDDQHNNASTQPLTMPSKSHLGPPSLPSSYSSSVAAELSPTFTAHSDASSGIIEKGPNHGNYLIRGRGDEEKTRFELTKARVYTKTSVKEPVGMDAPVFNGKYGGSVSPPDNLPPLALPRRARVDSDVSTSSSNSSSVDETNGGDSFDHIDEKINDHDATPTKADHTPTNKIIGKPFGDANKAPLPPPPPLPSSKTLIPAATKPLPPPLPTNSAHNTPPCPMRNPNKKGSAPNRGPATCSADLNYLDSDRLDLGGNLDAPVIRNDIKPPKPQRHESITEYSDIDHVSTCALADVAKKLL